MSIFKKLFGKKQETQPDDRIPDQKELIEYSFLLCNLFDQYNQTLTFKQPSPIETAIISFSMVAKDRFYSDFPTFQLAGNDEIYWSVLSSGLLYSKTVPFDEMVIALDNLSVSIDDLQRASF